VCIICIVFRVPTPPGKSWIFFLKISGPGKSWKSTPINPGKSRKDILENYTFFIGSNGKQAEIVNVPVCVDFYFYLFLKTTTVNILLHATVSAMDYTPNAVSKRCFFFIFKHFWAPKSSWKISHWGPGKAWKSPGFFLVKEWEPCVLNIAWIDQ